LTIDNNNYNKHLNEHNEFGEADEIEAQDMDLAEYSTLKIDNSAVQEKKRDDRF